MPSTDYEELFEDLTRRYGDISPEALTKVLCPLHLKIAELDKTIVKLPGQSHYRATFKIDLDDENSEILVVGRTGKFIPAGHLGGAPWREIAKGRIVSVGTTRAEGEIYVGSSPKSDLEAALEDLSIADLLEIDQYGASAKILSALTEATLADNLRRDGFLVQRMPEDTAKHLGVYPNYDFEVTRARVTKKVEVKSLWGTDTRYARLIHSTGRDYPTSSCKFETQDIFAVSLFLRTGNLNDFAFARSVPIDTRPHGLPRSSKYPEHVNQNPLCDLSGSTWFSSIDDVWHLA